MANKLHDPNLKRNHTPKSSNTVDPIIRRLRSLVEESPDLKEAAKLYEVMLPLLRDADLHAGTIPLSTDQVREKMQSGAFLLSDLCLDLDVEAVRELMIRFAAAFEANGRKDAWRGLRLPWSQASDGPDAARSVRTALEENRLSISTLLPEIASGQRGPNLAAAQSLGLDPDYIWTLAQNALKPALRAWCRQLTPLVEGISWNKGTCFVCGAAAALAELQENNQLKHLRCGACGADWVFRRLRCVCCGNEDHGTLKTLYAEKELEKMRVEACNKCRVYLKVISAFIPMPPEMLAIEDLATLHLDYIAKEHGYTRDVSFGEQDPDLGKQRSKSSG
jgi:FdhE protein